MATIFCSDDMLSVLSLQHLSITRTVPVRCAVVDNDVMAAGVCAVGSGVEFCYVLGGRSIPRYGKFGSFGVYKRLTIRV